MSRTHRREKTQRREITKGRKWENQARKGWRAKLAAQIAYAMDNCDCSYCTPKEEENGKR